MEMPRGGRRPGAGRKTRIEGVVSELIIPVRVSEGERAAWERTAGKKELVDWIRDTLNHTARYNPH